MSAVLTCEQISKSFNGIPVIADFSLTVCAGETVLLSMPSGAGKTTLLNILSGLTLPDSGTVALAGTQLSALSEEERARLRRREISLMHQSDFLLPWLSVNENVSLAEMDPVVSDLFADLRTRLGVDEFSSTPVARLSGGQRRRVCFLRSIRSNPRLLLLDEPTGGLDPELVEVILLAAGKLAKEGAACVISSHDRRAVQTADTVIADLQSGSQA